MNPNAIKARYLLIGLFLAGGLSSGCAPSGDISGWELVPKKNRVAEMETFPEIPLILPPTPAFDKPSPASGPIYGMYLNKLDPGSLFRRGYSAPAP